MRPGAAQQAANDDRFSCGAVQIFKLLFGLSESVLWAYPGVGARIAGTPWGPAAPNTIYCRRIGKFASPETKTRYHSVNRDVAMERCP